MAECLAARPLAVIGLPGSGLYLDTHAVATQARAQMRRHGLRRPIIVADPHHLPRAARVCARLGLEAVVPAGIDVPFDGDSTQPWTRGPVRWAVREVVVPALYRWRGWV